MIISVSVCLGPSYIIYISDCPHCHYPGGVDILVGGGGQGPPAGLPGHQVSLRVGLTGVDSPDL